MTPCMPYLSYLSYIPHIPYIWNIITTPTIHTIANIHAIHTIPTLHRKHSIPIMVTIHTIQTIHTVISIIPYPTDLHTTPTIHTIPTIHAIHTIPTILTKHTILSKHAIPDRPYTPYIPNIPYHTPTTPQGGRGTVPHPHHTTGGEGEDLIWGQYMGPIPWGGWQGLVHIYIYIHTHMILYYHVWGECRKWNQLTGCTTDFFFCDQKTGLNPVGRVFSIHSQVGHQVDCSPDRLLGQGLFGTSGTRSDLQEHMQGERW